MSVADRVVTSCPRLRGVARFGRPKCMRTSESGYYVSRRPQVRDSRETFRAKAVPLMRLKRNGPICYACGGMKHRRRPDGTRWCPRFGCLPSGRFLDTTGKPTSQEQRAEAVQRVAE